ncbi:MAG: PEP-CTERM sorting domain-containing protein [Burkholderiales bacterium]
MKTASLLGLLGLAFASQAHAVQSIDLTAGMAGGDALAASATSLFMTTAFDANDDGGIDFNFSGVAPLPTGGAAGSMEAFAGHPAGEYDIGRFDGSTSTATEGSVYKLDNIALNAGDILSFEWTFYTNEPVSGAMKDAAYFSLLNHTTALIATADGVNGDAGLSGFRAATSGVFSQTVSASGVYSLVFAVVDTDDVTNSSALGVNNLAITPVPEPRDWMLMLAGIGLVGLMVGRNKRRLV